MAAIEKIAKTAGKGLLRRIAGGASATLGPAGAVIGLALWLPELFRLFGWSLEKIRGSGLAKSLGAADSDEELFTKVKAEQKRLKGRDALAVFQQDRILQDREQSRQSFAHNRVGLAEGVQIQQLQMQIDALKIQTEGPENAPGEIAPTATSQEALTADTAEIAPRSEGSPQEAQGGFLTEDEVEDMRAALIEVGLPGPEQELA